MRPIDTIVIHCSATREGQPVTASDIGRMHRARGFALIGYHYFIRIDGTVEAGRAEAMIGAHVQGHNARSIGVCYAGGVDRNGKSKDTRTDAQKAALRRLVADLVRRYPGARILGHRDLSPDRDGDGRVEPHEWLKDCPCFDVAAWWASAGGPK